MDDRDTPRHSEADSQAEEDESTKNIKVVVRIRPLLAKEVSDGAERTALKTEVQDGVVHLEQQTMGTGKKHKEKQIKRRSFRFDAVLEKDQNQEDMFNAAGVDNMVDAVLDGYDATVFAYGQTGSGKTYTMEGYEYEQGNDGGYRYLQQAGGTGVEVNIDNTDESRLGLVPRAAAYLYNRLENRRRAEDVNFRIRCSYVQIYNEKILDLLNPGHWLGGVRMKKSNIDKLLETQDIPGLKMRYHSELEKFYVENLFECECETAEDLMDQFEKGVQTKVMGSHKLNAQSSRSHCMFTIHVDTMNGNEVKFSSRLVLIDLAGSERVSMTGAEGKTLKEATCINKSLFALRNVISAISAAQKEGSTSSGHVPFRDSKLTSLLQHSLGGTSHTLMIACISPNDLHLDENLSTLSYAARAKQIKNKPKRNEDAKSRLIRKLKQEIKLLKKQLKHAQEMSVMNLQNSHNFLLTEAGDSGNSASINENSPRTKGAQRIQNKLKQELLNSITMMKKMHEIELELRHRMEKAETGMLHMQKEHGKLVAENQRLREHEQVLLHLLDSTDGGKGEQTNNNMLVKQMLQLKRENEKLRDSLATAQEMASKDLYAHEYAGFTPRGDNAEKPLKTMKQAATVVIKKQKKKKQRKPQVMSVEELRTLLSTDTTPQQQQQAVLGIRPSKANAIPRDSPRKPLLMKASQPQPDEGRLESNAQGTVILKSGEGLQLPRMHNNNNNNNNSYNNNSNNNILSNSGSSGSLIIPAQRRTSFTDLINVKK